MRGWRETKDSSIGDRCSLENDKNVNKQGSQQWGEHSRFVLSAICVGAVPGPSDMLASTYLFILVLFFSLGCAAIPSVYGAGFGHSTLCVLVNTLPTVLQSQPPHTSSHWIIAALTRGRCHIAFCRWDLRLREVQYLLLNPILRKSWGRDE